MSYLLNDIDLSTYGFLPARASDDSNMALEGCWDMPERLGTTEYDWGDTDGVEPYVDAEDIRLAGRDIILHGVILADTEPLALEQWYALDDAIHDFEDLVVLSTPWGDFSVYVNDEIKVIYYKDGVMKLEIPFREPVPVLIDPPVPPSNLTGNVG